jgi:lipopolysaccharide transport system ATP-binding protein
MERGTILFVSHDTGSIRSLCNKAIWLEQGQVRKEGSPKKVSECYLEAFYESFQDIKSISNKKEITNLETEKKVNPDVVDQRRQFINSSNLRNDIELFKFNTRAASFGSGKAKFKLVRFLDESSNQLSWVVGGELVTLNIQIVAQEKINSPIVGFFIKDSLGQNLFGDNTWLSFKDNPLVIDQKVVFEANFKFRMPFLPPGDYSVTVAIAEGTQINHIQHEWIHDAIIFKSISSSIATGLVGIPMSTISLEICNE